MTSDRSAKEHLSNARIASLAGDQTQKAIAECERALALGLVADDEVHAHTLLGGEYIRQATSSGLSGDDLIRSPDWLRAEEGYIAALRIDRERGHGIFTEPIQRARLQRFDLICSLAGSIRAREAPRAGIAYLEERLACCDYLATSPLLGALLELGSLYKSIGEEQLAKESWQRLLESEPVDLVDEDGSEAAIRRQAIRKIRGEEEEAGASSGDGSGCAGVVLVVLASLGAALGYWASVGG